MSSAPSHQQLDHVFSAVESGLEVGSEKGDALEREIKVELEEKELWTNFKELTNEMIVTKTGRRMFPVLKVSISGLDPNSMYSILLDFVAADGNRWKYVNGEWIPGGKPEPQSPSCVYIHPQSPNFGAHWMKAAITFSKVKLSNKMNGGGQIMLNSLHKYEPRVHIVKVGRPQKMISSFSFPETQFIAVTAYQNEEITALKIKHNPFAKAFLDAKERCNSKDVLESSSESPQAACSQIGGWFLPGTSPFCSSAAQTSLSGGPGLSPSPSSYCEQYSSLRSHRPAPYPSPYSQRNASPTNYVDSSAGLSMLPAPDSWSGLSLSSSAGVLPTAASNTSQYPSLWPLTSNSISPAPQSSSNPPFLRGSPVSYSSLAPTLPAPSPSPVYDNVLLPEMPASDSQYDSTIARLASTWATITQSY
ncbi:T-box transcription factor T-A [Alligator mississippiensis]|uniref:Brachyury protein isoform A n=1 Tax=Alligator mississippiensis TaxID=8496 RepID=A0A151NJT6_ALLMI|nr:T-box transcription factor T-A [Alligator mississippiensis]KYO37056.1 brachyury protein isoform A [Alligator mississippiensis]